MRVLGCPPGRVLLHVGVDPATALVIEVSRFAREPFRSVKGYGLSPVGEYADWSQEPKARRDALDQIAACLEQDPTLAHDEREELPGTLAGSRRSSMPWLVLSALVLLLASLRRRYRSGEAFALRGGSLGDWVLNAWRGVGLAGVMAMLVGTTSVLVIRALAVPAYFFHQNGQGPFWIEIALRDAGNSRYGPGYAELFGWVARWGQPPDAAVFAAMATGSALIPWFGWLIARRAGAPVCAAWAVASLLAVHPLAIRLAQSESYFGVQLLLLFAAAAVLSGVGRRVSLRSPAFLLPTMAAGLLLAQVVRIHPTGWVPAAAVPLVLLCRSGSLRTRLVQSMVSGLGIGAIVLAASGSAVLNVLSGSLGQQWKPSSFLAVPDLSTQGWLLVLACVSLVLISRNRLRAIVPLVIGGALVFVAATTDLLGGNRAWIADAYRIQFAPMLLASSVALLRAAVVRWPRRGAVVVSAAVAVLGTLVTGIRYEAHSVIPTDALEQRLAMEWRTMLPAGANVNYLARAENRIVALPLYGNSGISADGRTREALAVLPRTAGSLVFYYRSSLCFTPEGAPACRAFEGSLDLEPIDMRVLPSESSLPWLPLDEGPIEVGLFRVRATR